MAYIQHLKKVRSIMDWTRPKNQKVLEHFNGIVNNILQFLSHAATITGPLTELTANTEWLWSDLHDAAFEALKRAAEKHQVLRLIDYRIPDMVWLFTDASPTGTGAWVGQGPIRDVARPPVFYSRKLTPSQNGYHTHHQKALALVEAIALFEYLLRSRRFTGVTDHESLTKIKTQKGLSGRQQRWLTFLSPFNFRIEYCNGGTL